MRQMRHTWGWAESDVDSLIEEDISTAHSWRVPKVFLDVAFIYRAHLVVVEKAPTILRLDRRDVMAVMRSTVTKLNQVHCRS